MHATTSRVRAKHGLYLGPAAHVFFGNVHHGRHQEREKELYGPGCNDMAGFTCLQATVIVSIFSCKVNSQAQRHQTRGSKGEGDRAKAIRTMRRGQDVGHLVGQQLRHVRSHHVRGDAQHVACRLHGQREGRRRGMHVRGKQHQARLLQAHCAWQRKCPARLVLHALYRSMVEGSKDYHQGRWQSRCPGGSTLSSHDAGGPLL